MKKYRVRRRQHSILSLHQISNVAPRIKPIESSMIPCTVSFGRACKNIAEDP